MTAYYNEIEPYAADWLRNLIAAGEIAPGDVDERSIEDVQPDDLRGYTQCHFFAGIGIWSRALRNAGWDDDRPVWTGSCPCPPFSAAGKGQRCPECGGARNLCHPRKTGHFICLDCGCDRHADGRHLWPELSRLVADRRPAILFGEQVASADGRLWLSTVSADLERSSYGLAGADLCAAGAGAPNIRQRLYFAGVDGGDLGDPDLAGLEGRAGMRGGRDQRAARSAGMADGLAESDQSERRGRADDAEGEPDGQARGRQQGDGEPAGRGLRGVPGPGDPGALDGIWRDADWLLCRDGKWRPVESGTFPLADGDTARVGRLRAYGNAINEASARAFILAVMDIL